MTAESVTSTDTIYTTLDGSTSCAVKSIVEQSKSASYFGINCLESVVLANGIKTSTFGRFHTVPAAFMRYAGAILGANRASALGDTIVSVLYKIGVI